MNKIKTFLPVFTGFYNTIFEPNESSEIDNYNQLQGADYNYDDFEFDYEDYRKRVAEQCVESIEIELDLIFSLNFDGDFKIEFETSHKISFRRQPY